MFKKIKKFYKNNRIYCILMLISILCIILMGVCVVTYFVNQLSMSPYGSRLDNIEEHDLGSTLDDLKEFYKSQEHVLDANVRLQGKIIYVYVTCETDLKNDEIQNIATSSLEKISDDNRSFYDMQFIFTREGLNGYFGSKNANATIITWSNFTYDTTEETTTTKK